MKFSIITASFNSEKSIADCVNSVLKQSYGDIEHIIIDGGSADSTVEIVKSSPNRVAMIISEPDKGIYDAINKGIKIATGDIIGLLHSDDELASDTVIEHISSVFAACSADVVYGDLNYVSSGNKKRTVRHWVSSPFNRSLIHKGWMPPHPAMFVRKELFTSRGDYDLQYTISSDYDFILRLMLDKDIRFEYLPEVITRMQLGGASNKNLQSICRKSLEDYRIIKKYGLSYPVLILFKKNISKFSQFFTKDRKDPR
jgi:glycosyltransferase involved in cell wall biosynthesis